MSERDPFLTETRTLVNADRARIDPSKLTTYSLNPDHPVGGHKARRLKRVLGFDLSNAQELLAQVKEGILTTPGRPYRVDRYGAHYTVDLIVRGANGVESLVRTGWTYDPGVFEPRLVTVFIP